MDFDGSDGAVHLGGDLLIQKAGDDVTEDLTLPWGQCLETVAQHLQLLVSGPPLSLSCERGFYRVEKRCAFDRLGEEVHRSGTHGLDTHRNVAVSGEEDHRQWPFVLFERLLQFETPESRQTPGASINERAIERPSPIPSFLVVTKESKSRDM
jgi:hypothetical protein